MAHSWLAQATTQPAAPGLFFQFFPLILIFFVLYFLLIRPRKTEQARHQHLLAALKRNDRVMTIGGMFGTIVQVKGDEITLKVDETTNTKITFSRSAIKSVVSAAPAEAGKPPG